MATEADTCRKYITPALQKAGWDAPPHAIAEQRSFTDGRIVPLGKFVHRLPQKRADYFLRYTRDFTLAVVEAESTDHAADDGMQQAKEYATILEQVRLLRPARCPAALHPRQGLQGGVVGTGAQLQQKANDWLVAPFWV